MTPTTTVALPMEVREEDQSGLLAYATSVATQHGLNVKRYLAVIGCESQWITTAVGDNGTSFGLAQLHNPVTDWGISIEEAKDPSVALPIMARAWQQGKELKWSCYKILGFDST